MIENHGMLADYQVGSLKYVFSQRCTWLNQLKFSEIILKNQARA